MPSFCPSCGTQIAEGAATCPACQTAIGQPAVTAALSAHSKPSNEEIAGHQLARLGDRLLATILDTLLLGAIFVVIGMWSAVRWGGLTASGFSIEGRPALITFSLGGLAGFLYYWILEGVSGTTLGKAIVGIQVRRKDGGKCSLAAALFRNVLRIVDGIAVYLVGFLIAVFSKLRQRLGDHAAGTIVVERRWGGFARGAFVFLWLGGIAGGLVGAYFLHRGASLSETGVSREPGSSKPGTVPDNAGETPGTPSSEPVVFTSGNLRLMNLVWTEGQNGPPRKQSPYKPGDDVYVKFDLTGFTTNPQGNIDVTTNMTIYDPNGLALDKSTNVVSHDTLATATTPLNYHFHFTLQPFVPGGTYKLGFKVQDAVKNTDAEFAPTFSVETGPPIAPASKLEIRNFHFSASQDGPPLNPAIFQAGSTVHYSYDLFGVTFRADRADFQTAFKIIGPNGRAVLDKPDWDTTDQTVVYHPANFFAHFSGYLTLPPDSAKGTYTEQFVVTDKQANTTLTHAGEFEVK